VFPSFISSGPNASIHQGAGQFKNFKKKKAFKKDTVQKCFGLCALAKLMVEQ
jgi:hypothetical protein